MKKTKLTALILCAVSIQACKKDQFQQYSLNSGSRAAFKGYLENNYFNPGTIAVQGEGFKVIGNEISGGEVTIPLSSILITNELSAEKKMELTDHLQSADFFNMAIHPNITYSVKNAHKLPETDIEGNNYLISGTLAMLGKPLAADIPAKIQITENTLTIHAGFKIDRTRWGILFASDAALPADKKIKNEIEISLDLGASKN